MTDAEKAHFIPPCSSSGLEVLLSTLQNAGDIESTLSILSVLDELISAGTDRRISYMISKGGSEALLTALVNTARTFNPNYTLLLPILHLLAKVGLRDRRIGVKAEDKEAVLLTLSLLRKNSRHARRAAACLWVLQVFCSSVSTATLLGENQGLDVIYRLIPHYTTSHIRVVKAAINALAALMITKANVRAAVSKGFVASLLRLYDDWHTKDSECVAVAIRRALLGCLHQATHCTAGRKALVAHGGLDLLYHTTQTCLLTPGVESLVEPAVQLMRKCCPKTPLPLTSDQSVYTFPLPGRPAEMDLRPAGESSDEESDDDDDEDDEENKSDSRERDYDEDLETDVGKLRSRPERDRPEELLAQYSLLSPELTHQFQELDSGSEVEESSSSSEEELLLPLRRSPMASPSPSCSSSCSSLCSSLCCPEGSPPPEPCRPAGEHAPDSCDVHRSSPKHHPAAREACPEREEQEGGGEDEEVQGSMVDRLLARHGACIPHHRPKLYRAAATLTRSIPNFSILAFPDFWGHLPPAGHEPMAPRKPHVQRQKVFEDIRRFLKPDDIMNPDDIINQVVFDLEGDSVSGNTNSLRFFSQFESGNLRKAVHVRRYEYDLILNADANSDQHTQWFYFEVSNMVVNVPYRFNIINCEKGNSQFNYGMQPVLYSVREALEGRPHWLRSGSEICYYRNHFCPSRGRKRDTFYTLTFTMTFKHSDDVCYIAYHYPYTYSALQAHLQVLQRSVNPSQVFFRHQTLCSSLAGNACPLITITAAPASRSWRDLHQLRTRPVVVLTARVHPGESNASWVMKGTLQFLLSSEPAAQSLRDAFIFKVIPMLNPDGVINGTHRCALNGEDLNRQWSKPDVSLSPTVFHAKGFLYHLTSTGRSPLVFCDYHGHSRKKNVFLYGCSVKETLWQSGAAAVSTTGLKEDPGYRTIPKTLDRIAPAFSFNSCNYQVEKSRSATARIVVWREMGVLRSYTMESTFNGCDQGVYKGLQTGSREMEEMGVKFCHSLLSVRRNTSSLAKHNLLNHIHLDDNTRDHSSHNCFEDDEPPCVEEIESSADGLPSLSATELDSDIDGNTSSADEEEEGGEGSNKGTNRRRGSNSQSQRQANMTSRLFPHLIGQGSIEALNLRRNSCNSMTGGSSESPSF